MKKIPIIIPVAILFATLLISCNLFKEQPATVHSNENQPGLLEGFHKKVSEEGTVRVEVIDFDDQVWEADEVFTSPVEKKEVPIVNKEGDIVMWRTEYVFKTKISCPGGCKLMKIRATAEDASNEKILTAAIGKAEEGKTFVIDWSVTNATVEIGDLIDCRLTPVSSTRSDTEVHYMLISTSEPRPLPVKKIEKSVPIPKFRQK